MMISLNKMMEKSRRLLRDRMDDRRSEKKEKQQEIIRQEKKLINLISFKLTFFIDHGKRADH